MALTKLDPTVIGQDSTGAGKITSAGGSVSIDSSGVIKFANTSANTITITSSGFLGIGTSPSAALHVKTQTDGNMWIRNSASVYGGAADGIAIDSLNDTNNAVKPLVIRGAPLTLIAGSNAAVTIASNNGTSSVTMAANGTFTINGATFNSDSSIVVSKLPKATGYNDITNANCNTIIQTGVYMGYGLTNGPGSSGWFALEVFSNGSDQIFQRANQAGYDGGRVWIRFSTNGGTTWGGWTYMQNYSAVLDYGWFSAGSKVDRYRGGVDATAQNSWTATTIQNLYGDSNEGYYSVGFTGHSEGPEVKNFGGSIGTVQYAHTYGSKPQYRNRTDNSSWGAWYQF